MNPKKNRMVGYKNVSQETKLLFKAAAQIIGQEMGRLANETLRDRALDILGKEAAEALIKRFRQSKPVPPAHE